MTNSFYSEKMLNKLGLKHVGKNVLFSTKASGYSNIELRDNCHIDDFCIISGKIIVGKYVPISAFCGLFAGSTGITMQYFSGLSSRISIYAEFDDFSGKYLTNLVVLKKYKYYR